jgi:hypothetical protein
MTSIEPSTADTLGEAQAGGLQGPGPPKPEDVEGWDEMPPEYETRTA